jgi:hypothetical protein
MLATALSFYPQGIPASLFTVPVAISQRPRELSPREAIPQRVASPTPFVPKRNNPSASVPSSVFGFSPVTFQWGV